MSEERDLAAEVDELKAQMAQVLERLDKLDGPRGISINLCGSKVAHPDAGIGGPNE